MNAVPDRPQAPSLHQCEERLAFFDDIGGELTRGAAADVFAAWIVPAGKRGRSPALSVDFAPGTAFGMHTNIRRKRSGLSPRGSLEYQIEGRSPVTLKAGDVLFFPAGTIHAAKNVGSSTASELATYVVEKASRSSHWCSDGA